MVSVFDSAPMSTNELMPLGLCSIPRLKAGDEVTNVFARFSFECAPTPYGDDASGVGEGAFHRTRLKHRDRTLLDSPMPFLLASINGGDFGEGFFQVRVKSLLVVFDLLRVVAAFFDGDTSGFLLIVQRVGGDDFSLQRRDAQQ